MDKKNWIILMLKIVKLKLNFKNGVEILEKIRKWYKFKNFKKYIEFYGKIYIKVRW